MVEGNELNREESSIKKTNGDCTREIKKIIAMPNEKTVRMNSIWRSRNIITAVQNLINEGAHMFCIRLWSTAESWTIKIVI